MVLFLAGYLRAFHNATRTPKLFPCHLFGDCCTALLHAESDGVEGRIYNTPIRSGVTNIEIAQI